jgi:hypothetical protein
MLQENKIDNSITSISELKKFLLNTQNFNLSDPNNLHMILSHKPGPIYYHQDSLLRTGEKLSMLFEVAKHKKQSLDFNSQTENGFSNLQNIFYYHLDGYENTFNPLLNHDAACSIDWMQPIQNGDYISNVVLIAAERNFVGFVKNMLHKIQQLPETKYSVNVSNSKGLKLIDMTSMYVDTDILFSLRSLGSTEPINTIIGDSVVELNLENVHDKLNESVVKRIRSELKSTYHHINIKETLEDLEQYLNAIDMEALNKFYALKDVQTNDHNTEWRFAEEIAFVWEKTKEMQQQEIFPELLKQLDGCYWGQLVNMFGFISSSLDACSSEFLKQKFQERLKIQEDLKFLIQQDKLFLSEISQEINAQIQKQFKKPNYIKVVFKKWCEELNSQPNAEKYSNTTLLINGMFNKLLSNIFQEKFSYECWSDDYQKLIEPFYHSIAAGIYYEDLDISNPLMQIITMDEGQIVTEVHESQIMNHMISAEEENNIKALGESVHDAE